QTAGQFVDARETGIDAGDGALAFFALLDADHRLVDQVVRGNYRRRLTFAEDRKDFLFGAVTLLARIAAIFVRITEDSRAGVDEAARERDVAAELWVMKGVGGGGTAAGSSGQVGGPADFFVIAGRAEALDQKRHVDLPRQRNDR